MVAWLLSADDEVEEIDVDLHGALLLPDDKLICIVELMERLTEGVDDVSKE